MACAVALLVIQSVARAQSGPSVGIGALDGLMLPRTGKVAHYSSHDRSGGNDDMFHVAPGQTITLVDHKGAGVVKRLWLTIAPWNNVKLQRQGIIRCYWDGETSPSVEVPVADFFGMGFGEWRQYISAPLSMTSGGFNCYWSMPFRRSARITFENRSDVPADAFYFNVDIETAPRLPKPTLYFHAQFRRAISKRGQPIRILESTGRGHYVGTLLSMQPLHTLSQLYLEGDEQVFVDGESKPSIQGTGTEDYFNSGWYFNTGVYSAPYHGVTMIGEPNARINAYRWHIEDPIPFRRSLRFQIEHGPMNDMADVYYSSVAYWYQTHPHAPFPPLPTDLMPPGPPDVPRIPGLIEAEDLLAGTRVDRGGIERQEMNFEGVWSGTGQLWWKGGQVGDRVRILLPASRAGRYELVGYFTRADDYGDFTLTVNGQQVGSTFKGYHEEVTTSGAVSFGTVDLKEGNNEITLEIVGKDAQSKGYMVGIDGFKLNPQ